MWLPLLQLSENTEVQYHITRNTENTIFFYLYHIMTEHDRTK